MVRVLIALDNFVEMTQTEVLFKKVGFDVECVNKNVKFEPAYLGINPRVVVLSSHGQNIDGVALARKMRRTDGWPKLILVIPDSSSLDMSDFDGLNVDYFLESQGNPIFLLQKVAQLSGEVDSKVLDEKLARFLGGLDDDPDGFRLHFDNLPKHGVVKKSSNPNIMAECSLSSEERSKRYDVWKTKVGSIALDKSFDSNRVKKYKKNVRVKETDESDLEQHRSDFANAMFVDDE